MYLVRYHICFDMFYKELRWKFKKNSVNIYSLVFFSIVPSKGHLQLPGLCPQIWFYMLQGQLTSPINTFTSFFNKNLA